MHFLGLRSDDLIQSFMTRGYPLMISSPYRPYNKSSRVFAKLLVIYECFCNDGKSLTRMDLEILLVLIDFIAKMVINTSTLLGIIVKQPNQGIQ